MSMMAERIKYKSLLRKKNKREYEDNNSYGSGKVSEQKEQLIKTDIGKENDQGKWQDADHVIKRIDYDNLERSLYMKHMSDYHDLIAHVNIWAVSLGFLVKLKRPPKVNQDGSKTLRVYCASFKKSKPLEEDSSMVTS